jgi:hypothetical protein
MMEAVSTSETSVNFYQTTRRNNPEDSHLHTHHCENLKSYQIKIVVDVLGTTYNYAVEDCMNRSTTLVNMIQHSSLEIWSIKRTRTVWYVGVMPACYASLRNYTRQRVTLAECQVGADLDRQTATSLLVSSFKHLMQVLMLVSIADVFFMKYLIYSHHQIKLITVFARV